MELSHAERCLAFWRDQPPSGLVAWPHLKDLTFERVETLADSVAVIAALIAQIDADNRPVR
jgi:hypothetical protein